MAEKDLSKFYGSYRIGKRPKSLSLHNQITWNKIETCILSGRNGFESLVEASIDHRHGDKISKYPYQFVLYCIRSGWLVLDNKTRFADFLKQSNAKGSGKASSYIRAIDLLGQMLSSELFELYDCVDIWGVNGPQRIEQLIDLVGIQKKLGQESSWAKLGLPKSYLTDGFCSAALGYYKQFLNEQRHESLLLEKIQNNYDSFNELEDFSELSSFEGAETLREVKARCNQNVFRRVVRSIYNDSCCITGLNLPELNIASHIVPWGEDEKIRLDPSNGLLLSATYDAAFDRHLISFDDDYRLLLSKKLRDYCTSVCFREYFLDKQGEEISLPNRFLPNKKYLEKHRSLGEF